MTENGYGQGVSYIEKIPNEYALTGLPDFQRAGYHIVGKVQDILDQKKGRDAQKINKEASINMATLKKRANDISFETGKLE